MLTDQQKQAVKMLCIDGKKVQDTAAALGVHRCTIWRWSRKKEFAREWNRLLKAYIREWREKSGYNQRRKEYRQRLRRLEKKMNAEAERIKNGHTKAFDAAWNKYVSCLMESEKRLFRGQE